MNKSEIAEKARKRFAFEQYAKTVTWNTYEGDDDPFAFFPESGVYANGDIELAWLGWQWRERAIAESQAPQPSVKVSSVAEIESRAKYFALGMGDCIEQLPQMQEPEERYRFFIERLLSFAGSIIKEELGDGEPSPLPNGLPLKSCIEPECEEIGTHLDHSPLTPFGESQLCQTPGVSNDPAPKYSDYAEAIAYHDALAKWVLRNFESGQMSAGRLACVFDCVEFATKQRESGAAQEVSLKEILEQSKHEVDSWPDTMKNQEPGAQEVSPRARAMKIAKEIDQECIHQDDMGHTFEVSRAAAIIEKEYGVEAVSPPSPEQERDQLLFALGCQLGGVKSALEVIEAKNEFIEKAEGDTRELKAALEKLIEWDKKWPKKAYIVEYGMISQSERELNEICELAAKLLG